MRLIKARVENYQSITDSDEFEINKNKTVLVGINESGQSAILEALHLLNPGDPNRGVTLLKDYLRSHYSYYDSGTSDEEKNLIGNRIFFLRAIRY